MTDKHFTGKPNAFEQQSAFPPIPDGLEPKKPAWLNENVHEVKFSTKFNLEVPPILDFDLEQSLQIGRRVNEMQQNLNEQAEAYLRSFLESTHLTPEEFNERFVVITSPGEIINLEDVFGNVFRATLTIKIEPRKKDE